MLYEQYAAAATSQHMESINNSLDMIAQENEQPDKISAFFKLLNRLTGVTMSPQSKKVMTMTVMDQWYAGSSCVNAYAYLARKYLGLPDI